MLQVFLCPESKAKRVVFDSFESSDDIQDWMEKKASESPMFHYWKMIFNLQILILIIIRPEREQYFALYVQVLKSIMKHIFDFNHYNHARWLTIHVDDLMKLELVCPNVYKEFCSGNFVIRKTINPFLAIALDQAHEQNKGIIKGVGGAVGLLSKDMDSALTCWGVAGSEVCRGSAACRLVEEYERKQRNENKGKHHQDYTEFRKTFFNDTQKFLFYFNEICNPFEENILLEM